MQSLSVPIILAIRINTRTENISIIVLVTDSISGGKSPVKNAEMFCRKEKPTVWPIAVASAELRKRLINASIGDAVSDGDASTPLKSSSGINPIAVLTNKTAKIGNSDLSIDEFSK